MSLETFAELIGCGEVTFVPDPTHTGKDGGSIWSITIPEGTILSLIKPNGYELQLIAGWQVGSEPLIQMLGRGYPSELEALPVVEQWVEYLRAGHTVQEWKNHHGIVRMDGLR